MPFAPEFNLLVRLFGAASGADPSVTGGVETKEAGFPLTPSLKGPGATPPPLTDYRLPNPSLKVSTSPNGCGSLAMLFYGTALPVSLP